MGSMGENTRIVARLICVMFFRSGSGKIIHKLICLERS